MDHLITIALISAAFLALIDMKLSRIAEALEALAKRKDGQSAQ
ncbi:MAG TPA: hypothetical protein VMT03_21195 [Polyangia bacterium]|nr:hypothetical protein [Polyangia bacterium]